MDQDNLKKSQHRLIYIVLFVIIVLTVILSFLLFVSLINVEAKFVLSIYSIFSKYRGLIIGGGALVLILLGISILIFTIRGERYFEHRINSMYEELETDTIRGIEKLPLGVINYEDSSHVIWANDFFDEKQKQWLMETSIADILKGDPKEYSEGIMLFEHISFFDKTLDIYQDEKLQMLYLIDKTDEAAVFQELHEESLVLGYLYIDTPEEIQVLEDAGNLEAGGAINQSINQWAEDYNVYVRKYSTYRWLIVTNQKQLDLMIKNKMNVRDYVNSVAAKFESNITISGGFANYKKDFREVIRQAIEAIELAQSRGGDQVVIKREGQEQLIFGGDNNQRKRTSRVMVRSTALSLQAEIKKYDHIYITGHRFADLDAVGAMAGLYQIANSLNKPVSVVLDADKMAEGIDALWNRLWRTEEAVERFNQKIIAPKDFTAENMIENSLMIITDVSTPSLLETPEIEKADNIIIIDHHRKSRDTMDDVIFEYIDPFSSSASEMVTELIQYQPQSVTLTMEFATLLLAGIVLDTKNYTRNVSSRTFEASSYLRKQGALQDYVLEILGTTINEYIAQSQHLSIAEDIVDEGKLLLLREETTRLSVAKQADFLLSFPEVKYAIVIGNVEDETVAMSARSRGSTNIQKVMEVFGGGGHYNNAAAQMKDASIDEIRSQLIDFLNEQKMEQTDALRATDAIRIDKNKLKKE